MARPVHRRLCSCGECDALESRDRFFAGLFLAVSLSIVIWAALGAIAMWVW